MTNSFLAETLLDGGIEMGNAVLFVDDEVVILNVLEAIFSREGFQTLAVTNGEDALKVLEQEDVDVVVADERMPGISGMELLSLVKERYPDKMRIVLTAYAEMNTMLSAINKAEAHWFIVKPFRNDEIVQVVRDLMVRQERTRENERSLQAAKREADFAYKATRIMCGSRFGLEDKYSKIINLTRYYIRARSLSLMLLYPDRKELVVHAATNTKIVGLKRLLSENSVSSWVAREGRPLLHDGNKDLEHNSSFAFHDCTLSPHRNDTFLSVPLKNDDQMVGVFNVSDPEEGSISPSTGKTISHLMRWVGAMVQQPLLEA